MGPVYDKELVGPYHLNAIDVDDDMAICWSTPSGDCVGDGLPGPTVFAAGYDDKYVVAAVHPRNFPDPSDRAVTRYYYVIRSPDENRTLPYAGIKGPFDEATFNAKKARLHLPQFSKVFDDLK